MAQTGTISADQRVRGIALPITRTSTVHKRRTNFATVASEPTRPTARRRLALDEKAVIARGPWGQTSEGTSVASPRAWLSPLPLVIAPASAEEMLRHRDTLPATDPERARIRTVVIEDNLAMAHRVARRYAGRGEPYDDLAQSAALALVKAVDGYDSSRPVPLAGYAIPSIVGSLKRHFRDTAWAIHVPRGAQELAHKLGDAIDVVSQKRGHTPTPAELAQHLDVTLAQVLAATEARQAYNVSSLDTTHAGGDSDAIGLAERFGATDPAYDHVDTVLTLAPLLAALPPRTRQILALRFADELSQTEIAAEVGLSQMHVSRLLTRALADLRTAMSTT